MKTDYEDRRKIARWCESAGLTPLEALTRLWLVLDEHREFIDDVGPKAKERIGRMEKFALDCRRAYWAEFESSQKTIAAIERLEEAWSSAVDKRKQGPR